MVMPNLIVFALFAFMCFCFFVLVVLISDVIKRLDELINITSKMYDKQEYNILRLLNRHD